ncbi:MAG: hypothetical protein R3335_02170 [Anaerolineales bacterium]|nr:hypothetical protein [Anaerolineales bacterium]
MENTYTYTARNVENPEQVVTLTLQNHHMSVGLGAPLEQIETALQQFDANGQTGQPDASLWLRPLAVSLLERGVGPFRIDNVSTSIKDDRLNVTAWYRAGGLALAPVTLIEGRVDNPPAAQAFVKELQKRKAQAGAPKGLLSLLDYWITWVIAGAVAIALFQIWRRRYQS